MSDTDPVVIVGMARTPMGGLLGDLSGMSANELGAVAVKAAVEEAKLGAEDADEIIMGNCLPAGQGQAPARQAGFKAGMDKGLEATTINKMCGSGLQAAVMGRQSIVSGDANGALDAALDPNGQGTLFVYSDTADLADQFCTKPYSATTDDELDFETENSWLLGEVIPIANSYFSGFSQDASSIS